MKKFKPPVEKLDERYSFAQCKVKIPDVDTDVTLVLPNGEKYLIQWRIENETIDICMGDGEPMEKRVYVTTADLEDGKKQKDSSIVGEQITIM